MNWIRHALARRLGLPLVAVLVGLTGAVPLLERQEGDRVPMLESHHDAGRCVVAHDHAVCILASTLGAELPAPPALLPVASLVHVRRTPTETLRSRVRFDLATRSRAPPSRI